MQNSVNPEPQSPGQAGHGQRTGPASGNTRGNDLPSKGGTSRDGRETEGTARQGAGPGRDAAAGDAEGQAASPNAGAKDAARAGPAKTGQPMDASEETAGTSANQDSV